MKVSKVKKYMIFTLLFTLISLTLVYFSTYNGHYHVKNGIFIIDEELST
jgi:cell division protein FtsL